MQGLMNGADCSAGANPLNQVLKREGVDNSLFRDRMGSPAAGSSSQAAFRPLQGPSQAGPAQAAQVPHPFNLSHLSQALSQPGPVHVPVQQGPVHRATPDLSADWERFQSRPAQGQWHQPAAANNAWAESFHQGKGKGRAAPPPAQDYAQQHTPMMGMGGMGMMMPGNPFGGGLQTYQPQLQPMYSQPQQMAPDHAKMEAAFEQALADARAQSAPAQEKEEVKEEEVVEEPKEAPQAEEQTDFKGDLDAVWESLKPEAERLNQLAEWEKEFSQFVEDEDDTFDILERDLNRDDIGQTGLDDQMEFGSGAGLEGDFTAENGLPPQVQYHFANPNKFDVMSPVQAWNEASRLLSAGGSLSDSALMIETFLRRATPAEVEQSGVTRAAAWAILGRTQAENEMEDKALAAFEEGRKAIADDPAARQVAGELLTNLAISYVNESLDLAALTTLHQLLETLHPTHAGQAPSRSEFIASDNPWALHQRMTNQYLDLARAQYASAGHVDPDVQVGLGTLYYMQGEFGEARSCWVAALGEKPDDYLLWNRLGATLANGGDPEEAVDAYRRALEIKPTFTRAIANLGVACLNIGVHREAAEHFLAALALQPNDGGGGTAPEAYSLWATLRRSLIALDQPQLAEQARPGTDLSVFRNAGFDF
ncbi:hypothetical protein CcaverHIS002_0403380 [Cutaneotrichosporon cavernicola]|uniref:TPR-like protein n=1 Tax=Cutaneotrichosporon cavernicola TaxID=279322 RepID=A0AA48QVM8_9TREE|nr:uncharacterized protein CcaverHIS019_0403340 [Cutaneotrichosporon cavernicola]BEI83734.1 hypothetical protein CcaverHIS002_0403380 [Cutaneotrichosporon cavernicola]BEI91514.1 hypothetical protein CcaverHIS019_0403340 [Cutaneotrichosporon cavernicola]BEI99289.1 hypothetical protein CcaverHIS631_0403320 [Cutaneotrichosporon cavernicola]BEJ07066.1 hypothetical protein CcaverHIS641_0403350 [Cutaneotrichosporon cavernicola]